MSLLRYLQGGDKMIKTLKASAGTGKTYRLSLEYVAALLREENFENIVVMTFTRKATAEIRERIFEHIEDILDNKEESEVFQNLREIYPDLNLKKNLLNSVYRKMLINKDKINIYTIDSFINQIFKKAVAPYLGIYNYEIIEDSKNEEIIKMVFKRVLDNKKDFQLLESFLSSTVDRKIDKYISLIKEMIVNRWKFLLLDQEERKELEHPEITSLLDDSIYMLTKIAEAKEKEVNKLLIKDYKDFIPEYTKLTDRDAKVEKILKNCRLFYDNSFWHGGKVKGKSVEDLKSEMNNYFEEFREALAAYIFNKEMIPYEEDIFNFYNRIFDIYDEIKFREKKFTHLDISNYTYKYFENKDLSLVNNNKIGTVSSDDIDINKVEKNESVVTEYFYELMGTEVNSLFIDEFQDTSILQWKILLPLINRAEEIITVGDEKQSIYGWRGGEKELFANLENIVGGKSESLSTCYRSEKEIIDFVNEFFLSIEKDWEYSRVNSLPQKNQGYVEILLGGESCKKNPDTKTFKKMSEERQQKYHKLNAKIKSNLKEEIARNIDDRLDQKGDIGILARKSSELNEIAYELDKRKIPYIYESKNSLLDHEAIKGIYSLLCFINYEDYFHLIRFMRSDIIGINSEEMKLLLENKEQVKKYLADIKKIFYGRDYNGVSLLNSIYKSDSIGTGNFILNEIVLKDYLQDKKRGNNFESNYNKVENKLEIDYLDKILKSAILFSDVNYDFLPRLIIEISGITDIYQNNSGALKNIYKFFSLMKNYSSLAEFIKFVEENKDSEELAQAEVKEQNAVKLMTIHKAKGLSFDTEFFYWAPGSVKGGGSHSLKLYVEFDDNYEEVEDFLLSNGRYEKYFEHLGFDFAEKQAEKELMEEINNVYVALTRPVENLFFYIEGPRQLKVSSDKLCWADNDNYGFYENALLNVADAGYLAELVEGKSFGSLRQSGLEGENRYKNKNDNDGHKSEKQISKLREYFYQSRPEADVVDEINERKNYDISVNLEISKSEGLAAHYYLEHVKYGWPGEKNYARKMALGRYGNILGPGELIRVIERVEKFIDKNREYFSENWEVFNEYVVEDDEDIYRIDRLLVDREKKDILIVDFKTGVTKEQEQLDNYREAIRKKLISNDMQEFDIKAEFAEVL